MKKIHQLIAKFSFTLPYHIDCQSYANQIALDLINQIGFRDKEVKLDYINQHLIHIRNIGINSYRVYYLSNWRFNEEDWNLMEHLVVLSMDKLFEQCLIQSRDRILINEGIDI